MSQKHVKLPNGQFVFIGKPRTGACEVHDWPTIGLAQSLLHAMRVTHGKGGIDVCTDCIERAKKDAGQRAGLVSVAGKMNKEQVEKRPS